MKIYVSEKVIDSVDFSDNEKIEMMGTVDLGILDTSEADVNYAGAYEIFAEIPKGTIVKSLEQHEAEIRKPLEDEIERLCRLCDKLNNDYFKQKEISDYGMKELNIAIRQLKQERQEVIAELEEWIDKNTISNIISFDTETNTIFYEDIKQKLNEMKGE